MGRCRRRGGVRLHFSARKKSDTRVLEQRLRPATIPSRWTGGRAEEEPPPPPPLSSLHHPEPRKSRPGGDELAWGDATGRTCLTCLTISSGSATRSSTGLGSSSQRPDVPLGSRPVHFEGVSGPAGSLALGVILPSALAATSSSPDSAHAGPTGLAAPSSESGRMAPCA